MIYQPQFIWHGNIFSHFHSFYNSLMDFLYSAQGASEIVKLMFKMQPLEKKISLFCTDIQKMTPLHCAAMFDHPELVEFLVAEGADINALGK